MNVKELLKPSILKLFIFLFVGIIYLYFAKESTCGASFFFAFCYKAYGFPFFYIINGDINAASYYVKTLFLGKYFSKYENFLFNPMALILDIVLIYLLACLISVVFKGFNIRYRIKQQDIKHKK